MVGTACWLIYRNAQAVDFLSYWAAAKLALAGQSASAYDFEMHRQMELTASPLNGILPFPYPPPFLMLVAPFGLLPYGMAFPLWVMLTALLYYFAARRLAPSPYILSHPGVLANGLIGQNGFLLSAVFIAGAERLGARPFVGGAILGLFVLKPQLGLLLPIAVIAARAWRAIAGAVISASVLLLAGLLAFGVGAYQGFLATAPQYARYMQQSRWPWSEIASPFAFARWFDVPANAALALHAVVAVCAAWLVWTAWRNSWQHRVEILAAATMLTSPYILTYDSLLLVVPIAWLVRQKRHPYATAIIWLCCLLPVASYFRYYDGPNTIPIGAILSLALLWMDRRRTVQSGLASVSVDCRNTAASANTTTAAPSIAAP